MECDSKPPPLLLQACHEVAVHLDSVYSLSNSAVRACDVWAHLVGQASNRSNPARAGITTYLDVVQANYDTVYGDGDLSRPYPVPTCWMKRSSWGTVLGLGLGFSLGS